MRKLAWFGKLMVLFLLSMTKLLHLKIDRKEKGMQLVPVSVTHFVTS